MAGTWRIRHKLILGMSLVVAIMALLLGGTLHGLASYRLTMGMCQSKLEELDCARKLHETIKILTTPISEDSQQALVLMKRMPAVQAALDKYQLSLEDTIKRKRAPDDGNVEKDYISIIEARVLDLTRAIREPKAGVLEQGRQRVDLLDERSEIRGKIDKLENAVNDLISNTNKELSTRIEATRREARRSIVLLITTSILAVLMMAGLLRFFYRWVAQPIRDLELGVSRVARGDFQYRIEIKSGDEIEDLARSYNAMTDKLRAMYENLAQQVNERSRQLVRSERLAGVGFLAAGVAHEINNPLASIAFCSEALESRLSEILKLTPMNAQEKDTITRYLKVIQEEALRCGEITKKLLTFSRGGDRKREQTNLTEILQGVLDMVTHLQNVKGKRVVFEPTGPILAWTNSQEVKQVFLNLVVNALESMEEGGQLTITHSLRDGMVELSFKDTGCGMTTEVLDNIFEPFFTRSRTGKGTGLGLSICHRIITQHGGDIEATSDGPNKGSTFRVRLPLEAPANASAAGHDVQDPEEEFLKLSSAHRNSRAA